MAGEIQLNSTTMATESSGSITAQLDTIRPNTTNGSLTLQGDSSDAGVTGLTIDSSGNATFAGTAKSDTIKPKTTDASLTLQGDSSGSGVTGITIDSSGVVNTTTAKVTNIQATSGQSLTIKDEDGNTAITVGTDNTATDYLSLNFGSYNGGSGSLTGNTLSDFEQGTWTATLTPQTSGTITLSTNTCSYIKIGNSVTVTGYLVVSGVSSPTGFLQLSTLPFTIGSRRGTLSLIGENLVAGNNILNLWSILVTGNTSISIYKGNGVTPSSDSAQMIQTGSAIWFTGTYFV